MKTETYGGEFGWLLSAGFRHPFGDRSGGRCHQIAFSECHSCASAKKGRRYCVEAAGASAQPNSCDIQENAARVKWSMARIEVAGRRIAGKLNTGNPVIKAGAASLNMLETTPGPSFSLKI